MLINITDKAIHALKEKLFKRNTADAHIRLGVRGGGCSGFSYVIEFEDNTPKEKDIEFSFGGVKIIVDNKSIQYLNGCTLDYEETLAARGFKFINPNENSRCGCGSSFSLKDK